MNGQPKANDRCVEVIRKPYTGALLLNALKVLGLAAFE
jgi:hypothetical protein